MEFFIQIQHLLKLNGTGRISAGKIGSIQIQHLLKLNGASNSCYNSCKTIQIQHLLKLNARKPKRGGISQKFKYNTC